MIIQDEPTHDKLTRAEVGHDVSDLIPGIPMRWKCVNVCKIRKEMQMSSHTLQFDLNDFGHPSGRNYTDFAACIAFLLSLLFFFF